MLYNYASISREDEGLLVRNHAEIDELLSTVEKFSKGCLNISGRKSKSHKRPRTEGNGQSGGSGSHADGEALDIDNEARKVRVGWV